MATALELAQQEIAELRSALDEIAEWQRLRDWQMMGIAIREHHQRMHERLEITVDL